MDFKTEEYKGLLVRYSIYDNGLICGHVDGLQNTGDPVMSFKEAKENAERCVDHFLEFCPGNLGQLAAEIEKTLVWTGYESCEVSPRNLAIILKNYMVGKNIPQNYMRIILEEF